MIVIQNNINHTFIMVKLILINYNVLMIVVKTCLLSIQVDVVM